MVRQMQKADLIQLPLFGSSPWHGKCTLTLFFARKINHFYINLSFQTTKTVTLNSEHIIIIMVVFSFILSGMCLTFVFHCFKKLIRDYHTIQVRKIQQTLFVTHDTHRTFYRWTHYKTSPRISSSHNLSSGNCFFGRLISERLVAGL